MEKYNLLRSLLHNLYIKINDKILEEKKNGAFIKVPYEEIPVVNIDYQMGSFQYDWQNVRYYEVYDWKSSLFSDLLELQIKTMPEYEAAVNEICSIFSIPERAKHSGIYHYVTYLMHRIPNNQINENHVNPIIDTFIKDFEIGRGDKLYTWHIKLWLAKFEFEGDSLALSDNVILRKLTKEDLILRRPIRSYEDEYERITGRGLPASGIVEFSMKAPVQHFGLYSDLIREEIEKWIDIFRLFKVGNVYPVYQSIYPDSIMNGGATENPNPPFDEGWEYKIDNADKDSYAFMIKKDEIPIFLKFSDKLKPILKNVSLKSYLQGNYLNLSFHKYKDALLKSNINVDRITSAIGSLEALLSSSPGEISYRISLYVSIIMRFLGFNSVKVFDKVRTAYSIRSQLVHGNKLSEDMLQFTRKHTHEIVNYSRLCLLIALQLKDIVGKEEFVKRLNYSLVDMKPNAELGDLIKKNVFIPVIYPFLKEFNPEGDEVTQVVE